MYDGRFYTWHNILDIAGFIHKMVCSVKSLDDLLTRVKVFLFSMAKRIKE